MGKDKLKRFAEFSSFPNAYEFAYHLKGKWKEIVFGNNHPIVLELGCGKGEYTVELARKFPEKNFIGIDLKSNRMWKGAGIAHSENLKNAAFLRLVMEKITEVFEPGEVSEIWITFPDPFPKARHAKHRLTFPTYLLKYQNILVTGGTIHFKTDDPDLFTFTAEMLPLIGIEAEITDRDVHHNPEADPLLTKITTHYEKLFMGRGRTIKYCRFKLDGLNEYLSDKFIESFEKEKKRSIQEGAK
jgi:tRNA (guanine-N7-)-methyltransferase